MIHLPTACFHMQGFKLGILGSSQVLSFSSKGLVFLKLSCFLPNLSTADDLNRYNLEEIIYI